MDAPSHCSVNCEESVIIKNQPFLRPARLGRSASYSAQSKRVRRLSQLSRTTQVSTAPRHARSANGPLWKNRHETSLVATTIDNLRRSNMNSDAVQADSDNASAVIHHRSGSPPSFHNLPYEIRCRIYRLRAESDGTDACSTGPVTYLSDGDYNLEHECAPDSWIAFGFRSETIFFYYAFDLQHDQRDGTCENHKATVKSYQNFRLISRQIRADILPFLCSRYCVYLDPSILSIPLSSPFPSSIYTLLSSCTRLFLGINRSLCQTSALPCCNDTMIRRAHLCAHDTKSSAYQDRLYCWQQLAKLLASLPQTPKLRLWMSCEVTSCDAARLAMAPFEDLRVQECHVRLRSIYDPLIRDIAQRAVFLATSQVPGFRYLDLPTELRLLILSFTDLGRPPSDVVSWSPSGMLSRDGYRRWHYGWLPCNSFCADAFTAFPNCDCARHPQSYFLVCRQMTEDARRVFYSSHRFEVQSAFENLNEAEAAQENVRASPVEAAVFLTKHVPFSSLQYLRNLDIEFSTWHYTSAGVESEVIDHWDGVLAHVAPALHDLTITVRFGPDIPMAVEDEKVLADQRALFEVHAQLLLPLRRLTGLRHFYVHTSRDHIGSRHSRSALATPLMEHERRMEELVMGSGYDSIADGKTRNGGWRWTNEEPGIIARP